MSNPFDAAIVAIDKALTKARIEDPCPICQLGAGKCVLEAAGNLTADDKLWLEHRVDLSIGEYTPIIDGMVCPGRAMKDRFRALLSALPEKEKRP